MTEPVNRFAQSAEPWLNMGTKVAAVCSFFILLGMWLGPQKDIPAQLAAISAQVKGVEGQVTKLEGKLEKTDWGVEALKNQVNGMGMQMSVAAEERNKLRDELREVKATAIKLESGTLTREMFIEWKSQLEARNRTISTPPLTKIQ